jgi:hypothetical protein
MLLANVRGGINSLIAEVLEDHIRFHILSDEESSMPTAERSLGDGSGVSRPFALVTAVVIRLRPHLQTFFQ